MSNLVVPADNQQTADAGIGAGVGSGSFTPSGGAAAVGAVKVQNLLGISDTTTSDRSTIGVTLQQSDLSTTSENADITIKSGSTASYSAFALPISVALTTGQFAGAFSGAFNDSRIAYNIGSTINASNINSEGAISISSTNETQVTKAQTDAGTVALSFNPEAGLGIAVGAADNRNTLDSITKTTIQDSANLTNSSGTRYRVGAGGDIDITATDLRSAVNNSEAVTVTVAGGIAGASGGGAGIYNTISNTTNTIVAGALDIEAGASGSVANLTISSNEQQTSLNAEIVGVSATVSLLGGSVGVGVVENKLNTTVTTATNSSQGSSGKANNPHLKASGNVTVSSDSDQSIDQTKAITVSAAAVAAAVNVAESTNTSISSAAINSGSVEALQGSVTVKASGSHNLLAESFGGSVGYLAGVGVMVAKSQLGSMSTSPEIQATIGDGVQVQARDVSLIATSQDSVLSDSISAAGGFYGAGAGANSSSNTYLNTSAQVGKGAKINASNSVTINSAIDQANKGDSAVGIDSRAMGVAVAGYLAGGGAGINNDIFSEATVTIGSDAQITGVAVNIGAANALDKNHYSLTDSNGTSPLGNSKVVVAGLAGGAGNGATTTIGNGTNKFGSDINIVSNAVIRATGTHAQPGRLTIGATNNVFATDDAILDAVSAVAAVFGFTTVTNNATATINATGASIINDSGDIQLTTQSSGTVSASNTGLSGALGFGTTQAKAVNTPTQTIQLDGTTIKGSDVRLWAGIDNNGVPNNLITTAESNMSAVLVGVDVPQAHATTQDTNTITISNQSELLARNNLQIEAEQNWIVEQKAARSRAAAQLRILSFIPIGSTAETADKTINSITVDDTSNLVGGSQHQLKVYTLPHTTSLAEQNSYLNLPGQALSSPLIVGSELTPQQKQALGLESTMTYIYVTLTPPADTQVNLNNAIGAILPTYLWNDSSLRPQLTIVNLGSELADQDQKLASLIAANDTSTSDRARYISQREDVRREAQKLGLLETETGVIQRNLDALAIILPSLFAAPGSVFLDAQGDYGTITVAGNKLSGPPSQLPSQIRANATASIDVSNSAPVILQAQDIVIDNSDVVDVSSGTYTVYTPGNLYVNHQGGSTTGGGSNGAASSITITQNPLKQLSLPGAPDDQAPPDLYLLGSVVNETGRITATNTTDSIIISGELRGAPINISAAGNFSLNSDSWFHTGADPKQYLDFDAYRGTAYNAATNSNGTYKGSPANAQANAATVQSAAQAKAGTIFSRGDININALYLNINGKIQSGAPDLILEVDSTFDPAVSTSLVDANSNPIAGITYASVGSVPIVIPGYADTNTQTIKVYDINSGGGNVTLTGQLLSTGAGEVIAFKGKPSLIITNNSNWSIEQGDIDLAPVDGQVTLINTPRIALVPVSVNTSNNQISFANPHGLTTGSLLSYSYATGLNSSGAMVSSPPIAALNNTSLYTVKVIDSTTIQLTTNAGAVIALGSWDSQRSSSFNQQPVVKTQYSLSEDGSIQRAVSQLAGTASSYTQPLRSSVPTANSSIGSSTLHQTSYQLPSGLTYAWTEGQSKTQTEVKYAEKSTFNFFWDFPAGTDGWDSINVQTTDPRPLAEGEGLQPTASPLLTSANSYVVNYQQVQQGTPQVTQENLPYTSHNRYRGEGLLQPFT